MLKKMTKTALSAYVPKVDPTFVRFGIVDDLEKIVLTARNKPYNPRRNVWISGHTGASKTYAINQICALHGVPMIRKQINSSTDREDLIGSKGLKRDGEATVTTFEYGPLITAMKNGMVFVADELDSGHPERMMIFQSVLDDGEYTIEETGEKVQAADGFLFVATANTLGEGDTETGRYLTTKPMNMAFMNRYDNFLGAEYPPEFIEYQILKRNMEKLGIDERHDKYVRKLVRFAKAQREAFLKGSSHEAVISLRNLVSAVSNLEIFDCPEKSFSMLLGRYDDLGRSAIMAYWKAVGDKEIFFEEEIDRENVAANTDAPWMENED